MNRQEFRRFPGVIFAVLLLFGAAPRNAGAAALPELPASASRVQDFVPKGWEILHQAEGDLNQDGKADAALVLRQPAETKLPAVEEYPRLLILLLQNPKGGYRLATKSEKAILCRTCGGVFGDPLADFRIQKGILIIDHYAGSRDRWGFTHRWRFQDGDWALIGETKINHDSLSPEAKSEDTNLLTGERIVESTNAQGKTKVTKSRAAKQPLRKLSSFQF